MKKIDALRLLQAHQQELKQLGIKSLNLFGSVALDQANETSDLDLLIELDESFGYFELFRIQHYLEDLCKCPIDLGTIDALREHLRQPILDSAIHVF